MLPATDFNQDRVDQEIFTWIANNQKVNGEIESTKYDQLYTQLSNHKESLPKLDRATDVLIVGAGEGRVEMRIIEELGIEQVNLWIVDVAQPKLEVGGPIKQVNRIPHLYHPDQALTLPRPMDLLICLGTSRYFISATESYTSLLSYLSSDGICIIDFMDLPPMRAMNTQIMGRWLRQTWNTSPEDTIQLMTELAQLSRSISDNLDNHSVTITKGDKSLGIRAEQYGVQQFLYEAIFPFWCKPGFDDIEIASQIMWSLMAQSITNTAEQISVFSRACQLESLAKIDLYSDTHILIARRHHAEVDAR